MTPASAEEEGDRAPIRLREDPSPAEMHELRGRLQEWNRSRLEIDAEPRFMLKLADRQGGLLGGAICTIVGRWLEVDYLWVAESGRGRGQGSRLLGEAERIGVSRGCERAFLTTFSFQARPFYEGRGYRVVHVQEGYPRTSAKYFMEKDLG